MQTIYAVRKNALSLYVNLIPILVDDPPSLQHRTHKIERKLMRLFCIKAVDLYLSLKQFGSLYHTMMAFLPFR